MKTYSFISKSSLLLLLVAIFCFCNAPEKRTYQKPKKDFLQTTVIEGDPIGDYVVNLFEDTKGNLWFGTMGKGVARYDGNMLQYFTANDGLSGNAVVSIIEDDEGNMWFGTHSGLSKYDGKVFTNFTKKDGLCHNRVANLLIDSKGNFWVGTWGGVCLFNGHLNTRAGKGYYFTPFPIPNPEVETPLNEFTENWVTEIIEDKEGDIWFARDGYGACKYDGTTFIHFTNKEGLASNNVQEIEEDNRGNIWFGARMAEKDNPDPAKRIGPGGLTRYDGKNFIQYPNVEGLSKNDVYTLYRDDEENIWISTIGEGVYKYDGNEFINFKINDSGDQSSKAVQSILKDRNGNMWFGCSGGLFRLNAKGKEVVKITTNGPWN